MSYKKNDTVEVRIVDMSTKGEGIGKADGYTLFVKDTVIGDLASVKVMKAKKNYGYARLMEIVEPSPHRVEPVCPMARQCGGCQLQFMDYQEQIRFKENLIRNNLKKIGGFGEVPMLPMMAMEVPFGYRNKAQFPIGTDKDGKIIAGFYAGRTHSIVANRKCYLGVDVNEEILDTVIAFMEGNGVTAYDEASGTGVVRHVLIRYGFTTKEIMVCLVVNEKSRGNWKWDKLVGELVKIPGMTSISLNYNEARTNVILGREVEVLWGQGYITDYIGDVKYQISPLSFYQVNPLQTKKLYEKALEFADLKGDEVVWDLYCGIGTISLFLAQKAKMVYGVEIVPQAIEDARNNARINGMENVEFFVGKAEEVLPEKYEKDGVKADVIVVDPPRKGCDEALLDTIVKMGPERVVYVSCDSATLARDLRWLCDRGYEVEMVQGCDQFGQTVHTECVVKLLLE